MSLRRYLAVARKELTHVLRDPRALGIAIGLPMLLLLLFGFALTLDVDRVPLVIWDQSQTPASRALIADFAGSPYFTDIGAADNYHQIEEQIDHNRALIALVVPVDFARRVASGRTAEVQALVDGSDANTASIVVGYADAVVARYDQKLSLALAQRTLGRNLPLPLDLRSRVWFNTQMESKNFIVPGLIAVIMMLIAALLTSLTIAREWETGTMEQLISTPVRGAELVLGKLTPYFAIGLIDMVVSVFLGRFLFHVPLRGNLGLLLLASTIFLVGSLAMGLEISVVTKNQLLASQVALMATFLPAFLLSGFMFPIQNMPRALQLVTYLVPARYFITILRDLFLKGVGWKVVGGDIVFLTAFAALMLGIALTKFHKRLD